MNSSYVNKLFSYHALNEDQAKRSYEMRDQFTNLANAVLCSTKPSAEQTLAIRNLREALFYVNTAIAMEVNTNA